MMDNLSSQNIRRDEGCISADVVRNLEATHNIKLPDMYVGFIIEHNGARLKARIFDYSDANIKSNKKNSNSITFLNIEKIENHIENLKYMEEPDWDPKYLFEDGLIPFGDNGGGDMICFDYRKNKKTDNPPVVIWNHDMGFDHRVAFIANNFKEFVDMLHEPEDEEV
ncbi:SMI1/KNR4 family protein [Alphaproteobacteria bacterium]|nr:SMI1/KNR4 family protein [Alphaproteobacteria bacterium]GHS96992.1 SMI1/KNR4 family protein [Alphaproteobacteria bacterium]